MLSGNKLLSLLSYFGNQHYLFTKVGAESTKCYLYQLCNKVFRCLIAFHLFLKAGFM